MEVQSHAEPFRHWKLSKVVNDALFQVAKRKVPKANWPHWIGYSSAWESNKRTCNDGRRLNLMIRDCLEAMCGLDVGGLTGIRPLTPDLYGGGLHVTDPGGRLDTHLDYALHPLNPGMERRVNVVLFLNRCDGGKLQFWNDDAREVIAEYSPEPNVAIVWECSDTSFHSVTEVTGDRPRASLAVYFCCPARPEATRKRALWVPRRNT